MKQEKPAPKFIKGQIVNLSSDPKEKHLARIARTQWNKEYKCWEYFTPPYMGTTLEFHLYPVDK